MIRRANAADVAAIADLDWRALHEPFIMGGRVAERRAALMAIWPAFVEVPEKRLYVTEDAQRLLGFAAVRTVLDEAELDAIALEPEARGVGLGRRLLDAVVEDLREGRVARVGLEVRAGNLAARRLYAALGFEEEGRRRAYYENGEDAVLYGLRLDAQRA